MYTIKVIKLVLLSPYLNIFTSSTALLAAAAAPPPHRAMSLHYSVQTIAEKLQKGLCTFLMFTVVETPSERNKDHSIQLSGC